MFGKNIRKIREEKGYGLNELSRISGVNASYISALERDEKKNPSVEILTKLANSLEVNVDEIMKVESATYNDMDKWDDNRNCDQLKEEAELFETGEFKTPEAAMQFILKQPTIMGYGGFNVNEMSDEDIISFANELLNLIKMLAPKYNK
ncbi:MAG: helix-turn-helix transcriptional regulator [Clostridium sp.]|uniref:helix-turn-helix domain-containing protein n=1 Tax=Clostridium sp. TaxID=1506 RepID=UPI002900770D|nr:helix-turn-helix transcriptional regulator [Clostridium sp.]MDU1584872.1 helix-turn-helix transcriptional regulator [Clostridium sp.]